MSQETKIYLTNFKGFYDGAYCEADEELAPMTKEQAEHMLLSGTIREKETVTAKKRTAAKKA